MEVRRRVVTEIPAILTRSMARITDTIKVTFYARVSTDFDAQEESFERQQEHFKDLIKVHDDWEFVEGYADQGITGTKAEARPAFMQMIEDARMHKFDRILVKSISRFARNTVDTLNYIRELKDLGIGVYFETQGIDTMTSNGEVLITILAAMAEQESRTISTNIKWSYKKRFQDGKVIINANTLGYKKDGDGYAIVEDEAIIVRKIFLEYVAGRTTREISNELNDNGYRTKFGKIFKPGTILTILKNEKYTGNAILGKTFKADVLSKKRVKNEGQETMYYVENSHPAIISKALFEQATAERERRAKLRTTQGTGRGKYSSRHPLSGLLVCGQCGSKFRRHSRSLANGEKIMIWVDINHEKNHEVCPMLPIKEEDIINGYKRVISKYAGDLKDITEMTFKNIKEVLTKNTTDDANHITEELYSTRREIMELFEKRKNKLITSEEYNRSYIELSQKVRELEEQETALNNDSINKTIQNQKLSTIEKILTEGKIQLDDPSIVRELLEFIKVIDKHTLEFNFKCGFKVIENI